MMAMADLASHSRGSPIPLADIAERQQISLSYLEQLFAKLRRGGLVKSVRGPGGGYLLARAAENTLANTLARAAENTRASDIILAVGEPLRQTGCTPGSPGECAASKNHCLSHDLWEELGNQIYLYLNSVSVADVCEGRVPDTSRTIHHAEPSPPVAAE